MTKREKGKDHERMKNKTLGQPIVIKERKGGKMATSRRGQHGQARKRVKGRKEERGI
jgi:hypothetical protein